jgi:2-hydroxychromene-2-carboxylate isomerase
VTPDRPVIDFWLDFSSNYSYLSAMRIEAAADPLGIGVRWRPFLLGPIFESFGWRDSPFVLQAQKGAYVWIDMARQCAKHGLSWQRPSVFPRPAVLPMKVAAAHADAAWMPAYCRAMMSRNFAFDEAIDGEGPVTEVLEGLGLDARTVLAEALSGPGKTRLREHTARAQAQGIFGAPTFFVGAEMFWGNDRLDDALECAHHFVRSFDQRRQQIVGDSFQLKTDVDV